jgi:hypothetical protein
MSCWCLLCTAHRKLLIASGGSEDELSAQSTSSLSVSCIALGSACVGTRRRLMPNLWSTGLTAAVARAAS